MRGAGLSILPGAAAFDPAVTGPMYRLLGVLAARADKHGRCWPLISNRIAFHMTEESPCPAVDIDDDAGAINIMIGES